MRKRGNSTQPKVGEANVLPVMNIMFLLIPALLLAMEVASMASIVVSPPKFSPNAAGEPTDPPKAALDLKVFIRADGYAVTHAGQQEGAEVGRDTDTSRPTIPLARGDVDASDYDRYDYAALEAMASELIERNEHESRVTISAEGDVPIQVLVSTMDALRGTDCELLGFMPGDDRPEGCLFYEPIVESGW